MASFWLEILFCVFGIILTIIIISVNRLHRFHFGQKQYIVCEEETCG